VVKVSIQHSIRIINFDSEVEEIILSNDLKIIKSLPPEEDLKNMDPSLHMWPNFIIQKTYNIKYKTPEYSIFSTDYIDITNKDFVRVLFCLRLLKKSAVFYDNKIVSETFEEERKKFNTSIIKIFGSAANLGDALLIKKDEVLELKNIYKDIKNLINCNTEKFFLALSRLSFGMERMLPRDRIIDYITGLEALYTDSNELKFRLSIILASIFESSLKEKGGVYNFVNEFYDLRSCIVHGSYSKKCLKLRKKYLNDKSMERLEEYLRKSLKSFIKNPDSFNKDNLIKQVLREKSDNN
jgi:hypothetical protein